MNNSTRNFTNSSNAQNSSSFKDKLRKLTTGVALAGTLLMGSACENKTNTTADEQKDKIENVEIKADTDVQEVKANESLINMQEDDDDISLEEGLEMLGASDRLKKVQEQEKNKKEYDSLGVVLAASEKRLTDSEKRLADSEKRLADSDKKMIATIKETETLWAEIETDKLLNMPDLPQRLNKYFKNCKALNMKPSARALELQKLVNSQRGRK
ncbi:MAG: hypothetical protein HG439_000530 [candidate division SR1 bacterium]|nr:hypothetical protein [candidate division SR1 bacterium]